MLPGLQSRLGSVNSGTGGFDSHALPPSRFRPDHSAVQHWLAKTEPATFSFDDLWRAPRRTTAWEGVRNYQARNFMRDGMRLDDLVLIYHSSCEVPGIVGCAAVVKEAYPDPSQFDPRAEGYDPKSERSKPRWVCVDLRARERFARTLALEELRGDPAFEGLPLLARGNRLSVMPVTSAHFERAARLAGAGARAVRRP